MSNKKEDLLQQTFLPLSLGKNSFNTPKNSYDTYYSGNNCNKSSVPCFFLKHIYSRKSKDYNYNLSYFNTNIKRDQKRPTEKDVKLLKLFISEGNERKVVLIGCTLIFLIFFTYVATYVLQTTPQIHNMILEYYVSQILSLKSTWIYLLLLTVIILWVGSSLEFSSKERKFLFKFEHRKFAKTIFLTSMALVTAFILSIVTTYLFAIIQVNLAVVEIKTAPGSIGVLYGKNAINNKLKSMATVPQITGSDTTYAKYYCSSLSRTKTSRLATLARRINA